MWQEWGRVNAFHNQALSPQAWGITTPSNGFRIHSLSYWLKKAKDIRSAFSNGGEPSPTLPPLFTHPTLDLRVLSLRLAILFANADCDLAWIWRSTRSKFTTREKSVCKLWCSTYTIPLSSCTCRIKGCAFQNQRTSPGKPISPPAARHTGISQEQLRRKNHSPTSVLVTSESYWAQRRPWAPSFSLAVLLFLVRIAGANIDDCDEGRSTGSLSSPSLNLIWSGVLIRSKFLGTLTWQAK